MPTGTIRLYDPVKGFGFICPDSGINSEDVFVDRASLIAAGLPDLRAGQRVHYRYKKNHRGGRQVCEISLAPAFAA
jgi:cold shock protein